MDQILQDRTQNLREDHRAGRTELDHIDSQILSVFLANEFQRVRTLAPELGISLSAVHRRLTQALGFRLRHTGLVPDLLTDQLKAETVRSAAEMLRILIEQEAINFADMITGDESWCSLVYSRDHVLMLDNENAAERDPQAIDTEMQLLTNFWSTRGPLIEE
jgi:hypothetical protein